MSEESAAPSLLNRIGLLLGPGLALLVWLVGPPEGLTPQAWALLCVMILVVVWWVSEAIPVAASALIPLVALPLFGIAKPAEAAAPYADPIIYLFVGGFILAMAVERWGLHKRLAYGVVGVVGAGPKALVAGFLIAAGAISMWISNTATTLILIPIAMGAVRALALDGEPDPALGRALALAVAYAASIGGVGTPIGSPTNLVAVGYMEKEGLSLGFGQWMILGVPLVVVMLAAAWLVLTPGVKAQGDPARAKAVIADAQAALGKITPAETRVMIVFGLVALGWIFRLPLSDAVPALKGLSDMQIAMAGVLALFLIPSGAKKGGALMDWATAERIPWGVALMFGAGLSMAAAMETTGVTAWLGEVLGFLRDWPPLLILLLLVAVTVMVSEVASNVATLTAVLPVVGAVAQATGMAPLYLIFAAAMGASLAFMMPMGTAPNAIAYATGFPTIGRMIRTGIVLNVLAIGLIVTVVQVFGPVVLG
jgi:solute carrier family 13 (sodium-dependent dicarboxylate transporter), member 2/3/5